jgi:hypothetical protein
MKKFATSVIIIIISYCAFAQEQATIASSNLEAIIANKMAIFGDLFDPQNTFSKFEIPKSEGKSPIYLSNLWITGTNEDSTAIFSSSETYKGYSGNVSLWGTGPITTNTSPDVFQTYNRVWSITKLQINIHKAAFNDPQYQIPEVIKNWPANGNEQYGESKVLAPYEDVNKNGSYDPKNGDYPIIVGDNAVLCIFNDASNPNGFGIEVIRMVYTYNNTAAANNLFVNYTVKNRSANTYRNVRLSTWNDFDIGNASDDYVGSVPTKNAILAYNGDNNDEDGQQGQIGYGVNPPAFGTKFLNATSASSLYYNIEGGINGEPREPIDYYYYANAYWQNGTPMYYGGNGIIGTGGTADSNLRVNHMYPGHPADTTWNEVNAGNQPSDRRILMSTEAYDLAPTETICLDLAYCYGRYSGVTPYEFAGYDSLMAAFDSTQKFYDNQISLCSITPNYDSLTIVASDYAICVNSDVTLSLQGFNFTSEIINWNFPNAIPSSYEGFTPPAISYASSGVYNIQCTIHFLNGDSILIDRPNFIEVKQPAPPLTVEGINIQFYDSCSLYGFFLTHINPTNYDNNVLFEYSTPALGVFASSYTGHASSNAPIQNGDTLTLTLTSTDECLNIQIASTYIIVALLQPEFTTAHHPSNILEVFTDKENVTYQWYYVKPDGGLIKLVGSTNSTYQALGNARFLVAINFGEGCVLQSDIFVVTTVGIQEKSLEYNLSISPNPSNGQNITVHNTSASQEMLSITIFNSIGKAISTTNHQATSTFELNTGNLPCGQYLIHFESEAEQTIKPLIIL